MTKVKALISFNAYNITAEVGEEFEIEDKGKRLDLEKLGWIEPLGHEVSEISEDMNVTEMNSTETKKAAKRTKE